MLIPRSFADLLHLRVLLAHLRHELQISHPPHARADLSHHHDHSIILSPNDDVCRGRRLLLRRQHRHRRQHLLARPVYVGQDRPRGLRRPGRGRPGDRLVEHGAGCAGCLAAAALGLAPGYDCAGKDSWDGWDGVGGEVSLLSLKKEILLFIC